MGTLASQPTSSQGLRTSAPEDTRAYAERSEEDSQPFAKVSDEEVRDIDPVCAHQDVALGTSVGQGY